MRMTGFAGVFFVLVSGLALFGSAFAQSVAPPGLSLWDMLKSAGVAILPIIGLSILALGVSMERLRNCSKSSIVPDGLAARVSAHWRAGDIASAEQALLRQSSALAQVLNTVLANRHLPHATVAAMAGDQASLLIRQHNQRAYALAVTATVAPIVGLLGTVVGMIEAFHVIALAGMGDPTLLAGGISKALVNTAAGLSVALPSLLAHHFFKHRLSSLALVLEQDLNRVLTECMLVPQKASHAH